MWVDAGTAVGMNDMNNKNMQLKKGRPPDDHIVHVHDMIVLVLMEWHHHD